MLRLGDRSRSCRHVRNARPRRYQPGDRRAGRAARGRQVGAHGDDDLRDVRLRGRVALPGRACRPRAGSAAASRRRCPGSSASGCTARRSTPRGNSVRGVGACEWLSQTLGLHLLLPHEQTTTALRRSYRGRLRCGSKRGWRAQERELLDEHGTEIAISELAGDQSFASTELLVRSLRGDPVVTLRWWILDLLRVTRLDQAAVTILAALARRPAGAGRGPSRSSSPTSRIARARPCASCDGELPTVRCRRDRAGVGGVRAAGRSRLCGSRAGRAGAACGPGSPARAWRPSVVAAIEARTTTQDLHAGNDRVRGRRGRRTASTSSEPGSSPSTCACGGRRAGDGSARSEPAPPSASSPSSMASRGRRDICR